MCSDSLRTSADGKQIEDTAPAIAAPSQNQPETPSRPTPAQRLPAHRTTEKSPLLRRAHKGNSNNQTLHASSTLSLVRHPHDTPRRAATRCAGGGQQRTADTGGGAIFCRALPTRRVAVVGAGDGVGHQIDVLLHCLSRTCGRSGAFTAYSVLRGLVTARRLAGADQRLAVVHGGGRSREWCECLPRFHDFDLPAVHDSRAAVGRAQVNANNLACRVTLELNL